MPKTVMQGYFYKHWLILLIVTAGFLLRVKGLTHQSLWLDELHTMVEADPSLSWKEMFGYLRCCDPHPPLYFITERIAFTIFGHTEFVARFISVLAGTASIAAIYFLGRELSGKNLGLIAAALTSVNYYNLFYSQEARCYIFAFLFAILSFLFFVRLARSPGRWNMTGYALFTLCFLYSHYYSLFALVAQAVAGAVFISQERGLQRTRMIKFFMISAVVVAVVYIPMIPYLAQIARIKTFWIGTTDTSFLQNYFSDFFGNSPLLKPVLLALILLFVMGFARESNKNTGEIKSNPLLQGFLLLLFWVFITVLIPYLRSLLLVPMLFPRYTIVILPAIILAIAWGIELLKRPLLQAVATSLVVLISLISIFAEKKYYNDISKTQFREMTAYIVQENRANYPIINQETHWHQQYYLKKFGSKARTITGNKESLVDSILTKSSAAYDLEGFWMAGAHGEKPLNEEAVKKLDTAFILLKQKDFRDAWARLYVSKMGDREGYELLLYNDFTGGVKMSDHGMLAIWNGSVQTDPIALEKGKYTFILQARGDPAAGEFPHLNIYINDLKVADLYVSGDWQDHQLSFENDFSGNAVFRIEMDNDYYKPGAGDRNAFIKTVSLWLTDKK